MCPVPGGQHLADHLDTSEEVGVDCDARVAHVGCTLGGERILRWWREHGDVVQGVDVELVAEEPSPVGQVVHVLSADDGDVRADEGRERLPRRVPDGTVDCRMAGVQDDEVPLGVKIVVNDVMNRSGQPDELLLEVCREKDSRIDLSDVICFDARGISRRDRKCRQQCPKDASPRMPHRRIISLISAVVLPLHL